ncbi:hypothetical protein [Virgibacillus ainsalahensis]
MVYLKAAIDPEKLEKCILPCVQEYIYNDLDELNDYISFTKPN